MIQENEPRVYYTATDSHTAAIAMRIQSEQARRFGRAFPSPGVQETTNIIPEAYNNITCLD